MTRLTRPVTRVVEGAYGLYVVTLTQAGLTIRERGRSFTVGPLSYGKLYVQGALAIAEAQAEAKRTRRRRRG
jgi:hypothetical protein